MFLFIFFFLFQFYTVEWRPRILSRFQQRVFPSVHHYCVTLIVSGSSSSVQNRDDIAAHFARQPRVADFSHFNIEKGLRSFEGRHASPIMQKKKYLTKP